MPAERRRAVGRRGVLAVVLGVTTGAVTAARWNRPALSPGTGTGPDPAGALAASASSAHGTSSPGPSVTGGGVDGAGVTAAVAPGVAGRPVPAVGRLSGPELAADWTRMQADPAYAWAVGSGFAAPVRPLPYGPLTGGSVLPRGGRTVFPRYRLMGYCGLPGAPALGRLGIGRLPDRVAELERRSLQYADGRQPLPVLELIAVIVQGAPGRDGKYRARAPRPVIQQHLDQARRSGALLLLNIQPGRARFLDEVRALEPWLRQPDVGVALDPEWAVGPGQVPGRVFGHVTGSDLDMVAGYLGGLVADGGLPEKVMVVHQLAPSIIRGQQALRRHPGVVMIKSVDGIGSPAAKIGTWRRLVQGMPPVLHPGFKLFFDEDSRGSSRLMTPREVLALTPTPEYVLYE